MALNSRLQTYQILTNDGQMLVLCLSYFISTVFIIIFFLFFSGNTDLLCQNQVNIVAKPNLLWNFRFPRHLHPQFLQQQIRILHNLIKKFLSIHHNRKIKPNRQKLGLICPMTLQQKTRQTPLGEAYYAKLKAKSILMNKKKKKKTMLNFLDDFFFKNSHGLFL